MVSDAHQDVALTETEARIWRRRLDTRRKNRHQGASYVSHNHATSRGVNGAWDKPASDELDQASYYERQQKKYGRGRRGSTSFSGAFHQLFDEYQMTQRPAAQDGVDATVQAAAESARRGDVEPLCDLAVELAVKLKSLQRDRLVRVVRWGGCALLRQSCVTVVLLVRRSWSWSSSRAQQRTNYNNIIEHLHHKGLQFFLHYACVGPQQARPTVQLSDGRCARCDEAGRSSGSPNAVLARQVNCVCAT